MHRREILLLAATRQPTMRDVQPGASKRIFPLCSLVVIESNEGRFSYSPEAEHLLSSFGAWWRVRESLHHAPNDIERVQTGKSEGISPSCSLVIWSVVGKFSYSSQAGHLIVVWHMVPSKRISPPCTKQQQEGPHCDEKENLPTML